MARNKNGEEEVSQVVEALGIFANRPLCDAAWECAARGIPGWAIGQAFERTVNYARDILYKRVMRNGQE